VVGRKALAISQPLVGTTFILEPHRSIVRVMDELHSSDFSYMIPPRVTPSGFCIWGHVAGEDQLAVPTAPND
jgi:hypothetical protein